MKRHLIWVAVLAGAALPVGTARASWDAMVPEALPERLLIVGSGAIGVEFASFYRDMGAEVTLVEILPQILPAEDREIARTARKAFEKQGIEIHTETRVASIARRDDGVTASLELVIKSAIRTAASAPNWWAALCARRATAQ